MARRRLQVHRPGRDATLRYSMMVRSRGMVGTGRKRPSLMLGAPTRDHARATVRAPPSQVPDVSECDRSE